MITILNAVNASQTTRKKVFRRVHAALGGDIRILISGAAQLDRTSKKLFHDMGFSIVEGYGMTEASGVVAAEYPNDPVSDSSGRVLENIDIFIHNPDTNGNGEIYVRGTNVMSGYLNKGIVRTDAIDDEGYYHTGDLGYVDAERNLFITGRKDKVLVLGSGENVSVTEMTSLLTATEGIERVYLADKNGYISATIFTKQDNASIDQVVANLNKTLPRYKQIHHYETVNDYAMSRMKK